jgi:membrane-anchored protein YejM (alkaline phosphatase superfamily)
MKAFDVQHEKSILFITLDSCRYDTFFSSNTPNLSAVGPLHRAMAPGNFTYGSHAAMFVGFTPGIAGLQEPFLNPKYGKIFKITGAGFPGKGHEFLTLEGSNLIVGLKRLGYKAFGSGAVGWFNPASETGQQLTRDFDDFYFSGNTFSLRKQLDWLSEKLNSIEQPVFAFLNIGETHVPYFYEGAPWERSYNPCIPFSDKNDAAECRRRQQACLEFVDHNIGGLIEAFRNANTIICADHGDCWGEDGLWEHGIHHQKVFEVPLLFRLRKE